MLEALLRLGARITRPELEQAAERGMAVQPLKVGVQMGVCFTMSCSGCIR